MSDRIRVVRLLPELDFGGAESRVVLQCENMDHSRVDLRVCAFHKPGRAAEQIQAAGIPVDILDVPPLARNPWATLALAGYLAQQKPDVLHASIAEAMFHGGLAGHAAGVPKVIVEEVGMPSRSRHARILMAVMYRCVTDIVCVSRGIRDVLVQDEWAPTSRIRVIHTCGKPLFFEGEMVERNTDERPFRFLTVGRLVDVKNQATLIRAFAQVHQKHPDTELWIAGDGPLMEDLQALVASLELTESVQLLGFRKDVKDLLESCDVFCLSSLNEGCSIAMIEAMATGIPVLGSDVSGIAEVMEHMGSAARLVEPRDQAGWVAQMIALMELDDASRREYGTLGREVAFERFSPEAYMTALHALYDEVRSAHAARLAMSRLRRTTLGPVFSASAGWANG